MTAWRSPIPRRADIRARVYRPGTPPPCMASYICDQGWTGRGVRVFRWPCGTLAVVSVGTPSDARMLSRFPGELFATYARRSLLGDGPLYVHVLADIRCAA